MKLMIFNYQKKAGSFEQELYEELSEQAIASGCVLEGCVNESA